MKEKLLGLAMSALSAAIVFGIYLLIRALQGKLF